MAKYKVRYIHGPNGSMSAGPWEEVEAENIHAALALKSPWPVHTSMDQGSAWAQNPGTSLYHVETWEAELIS